MPSVRPFCITPVPCLQDNYAYLVTNPDTSKCAVVDPSQAQPIVEALERQSLELTEIWITHHHWDHVGGIAELKKQFDIPVRGGVFDHKNQRIEGQTHAHGDDDTFTFEKAEVRVIEIPGHTLGAVAYLTGDQLFTGDTLFLAGCGRLFEGTPAMMADSFRKIRALPADTQIYCGHEYTVNNLRFAQTVEPENTDIRAALTKAELLRAEGKPTVPWTLAQDAAVNPFMRFDLPRLQQGQTPEASFGALREAKDNF